MERSLVDLMPRSQLIGYIATWLAAFALISASIVALEYNRLESRFDTLSQNITLQVAQQLNEQQMALESFAHSLSALDEFNYPRAKLSAQSLLQHSPNLYMLAIASRVEPDQRQAFEQYMATAEARGYHIQTATADTPGNPARDLYPVVLLVPERPEARSLLGLDLASEPSALGGRLSGVVAPSGMSKPIQLGNGPGYLLYHAIDSRFVTRSHQQPGQFSHYALLAVSAEALFAPEPINEPGFSLRLISQESADTPAVTLFESPPAPGLALPIAAMTGSHRFGELLQGLELRIEYQPSWQALDHWHLAGLLGGLCLLMLQAYWVLRRVWRTRQHLLEQQHSLYNKAHFDHLTGLPNTNLLLDRLEQAIRSAQRTASRVAVFFLDLDDFKQVNDAWGHDVGDQLLIQIGVRLRESMRSEDTVARIHGDEFVILIPIFSGERQLDRIRGKLEALFERPFKVGEIVLNQSGSFGLAVYPEDADDAEGLLGLADRQMYLRKQSRSEQRNAVRTA
ncbi:sensor domain-containing diguanylate cyclase [Marinobacterium rhizophilum]|uniref:Sensor domain-containing diguanylate cyclase n=1 Tax=Marinobacterium rhizophilum TaxID=420402 RepID=A0ABY5HH95_9GAMM|nr:sensor domain-containing diguanylate cyclase [Marinobacterium rhizophilum]UTW10640.1 sensor domain-containing diguanylate cyclase [Marinobacterium rhizophilum]